MEFVENFGYFIAFIGSLVFFHELGHFLVAKACDVKVVSFSLGFGPELFSFVHGETRYRVAALRYRSPCSAALRHRRPTP